MNSIALDDTSSEFLECIEDLLLQEDVQKLSDFHQHLDTNRLQHCLNVSYYSYLFSKMLNLDYKSAARAGILHDLFLYDWRQERQPEGKHAFAHPKVALRNAEKITELNDIEKDSIVNHMFPVTITFPRYKEAYIVNLADKYCAAIEIMTQLKKRFFKSTVKAN